MSGLLVACLCAEWCDTCGSYRTDFAALEIEFPQHYFVWIDVEEEAALLGSIEVENFPTLLVAAGDQLMFAGVMLPQIARLKRLLIVLEEQPVPQVGSLSDNDQSAYRGLAMQLKKVT